MDYSELIKKFGYNQKISYTDLLDTREWNEKRITIIQRDNFCCTNCGKTQSVNYMNFNILFQKKDRLISQKVVYENKSIDCVKEELGIKKINIMETRDYERNHCGVAEDGQLFLVNYEEIKEVEKSHIVINSGVTELGTKFLIIGKLGQKYFDNTFSIPVLSENPVVLHVHHKFYIKENLPWNYDNKALITLCNWCHWELHEQTIIPVYTMVNGELHELNYTPCSRCNGAGVFPEFRHIHNGVCFKCNGNRYEKSTLVSKF
jgi:hypothetical protein